MPEGILLTAKTTLMSGAARWFFYIVVVPSSMSVLRNHRNRTRAYLSGAGCPWRHCSEHLTGEHAERAGRYPHAILFLIFGTVLESTDPWPSCAPRQASTGRAVNVSMIDLSST